MNWISGLVERFRKAKPLRVRAVDFEDGLDWLTPPEDIHNVKGWDQYWQAQVQHGLGPRIFDMFVDDQEIVDYAAEWGFQTVLCVGNGISQEPRALARAGLRVTALDSSFAATELARSFPADDDFLDSYFRSATQSRGVVEFVVGDFRDPSVCPGPYDIIIERCTLQLFSETERGRGLRSLTNRLATPGVFVSHCHDGAWKPPGNPFHATEHWFGEEGFSIWRGFERPKITKSKEEAFRRVAWIQMSTG